MDSRSRADLNEKLTNKCPCLWCSIHGPEIERLRSQRDELLAAAKRMVGADTCDCYLNDPLDPECAWCQLSKAIAGAEADNAE